MNELKTSEQWQKENTDILVLDADGWDRKNFQFSWYEEEITWGEYNKRLFTSTVQMSKELIIPKHYCESSEPCDKQCKYCKDEK